MSGVPDLRTTLVAALARGHDGAPWHGPSRAALLSAVSADEAAWDPGGGAHGIWATVLHMWAWTREVTRRVRGAVPHTPVEGDWPAVPAPDAAAWAATITDLDAAHRDLLDAVRTMPPERLEMLVPPHAEEPGNPRITFAEMLRSLADHDLYHSGQVALLARLARAARASGSDQ